MPGPDRPRAHIDPAGVRWPRTVTPWPPRDPFTFPPFELSGPSHPDETLGDRPRGAEVDRIIKISNWPQAIVACAGLAAAVGAIWALSHAGLPLETIVGAVLALMGISGGQLVIARRSASVEAKTDQQSDQLATIVRQTNGLSEAERQEIADRAAVKVIEAYRRGDLS